MRFLLPCSSALCPFALFCTCRAVVSGGKQNNLVNSDDTVRSLMFSFLHISIFVSFLLFYFV